MDKWIPVSERLPEYKGLYLVTYHTCYWDDVDEDVIKVGIDTFKGKTKWAQRKYQRVIAWMPLPEPYKEENDHKCHTCKHYTSGEYDGSCDSYICEHYSGWESEE